MLTELFDRKLQRQLKKDFKHVSLTWDKKKYNSPKECKTRLNLISGVGAIPIELDGWQTQSQPK